MGKMLTATALILTLAGTTAQAAAQKKGLFGRFTAATPKVQMLYEKPAASYSGQHFTNSLGCVYSRTQAPGYPMVWHLQVNSRVPGCPNTIPGA